jgi:hypothetical protein
MSETGKSLGQFITKKLNSFRKNNRYMSLNREEAEKEAQYELRFGIGNLPHLGDPTYEEKTGRYIFPIKYTKPDIPSDTNKELKFYETQTIGKLIVESDGTVTRTSNEDLNENIREIDKAVENGELESK